MTRFTDHSERTIIEAVTEIRVAVSVLARVRDRLSLDTNDFNRTVDIENKLIEFGNELEERLYQE